MGSLYNFEEGFLYLIGTIYWWVTSNNSWLQWFWFVLVGFLLNTIVVIFSFNMDESPRWLVKMGRYDEALKLFRKMAARNGKADVHIEYADIAPDTSESIIEYKITVTNFKDSHVTVDDVKDVLRGVKD